MIENTLALILLCFALVFAVIAAVIMQGQGRWHFGWTALAFFLASQLVGGVGKAIH
jgi:hypothetical protein